MINILGGKTPTSHLEMRDAAIRIPQASVHMYNKVGRPARKVGHITVRATTMEEAGERIQPLIDLADRLRAERISASYG